MKIVFLSHTAPSGVFRVGSHHLSRELARAGHDVVHLATPVSVAHVATAIRNPAKRARLGFARKPTPDDDGVTQFVPHVVAPLSRLPQRWNERQLDLFGPGWTRALQRFVPADVVFIDQPLLGAAARWFEPGVTIYRPTDAHHDRRLRQAEVSLLGTVDGIAATSGPTLAQVTDGLERRGAEIVIENGVEFEHFESARRAKRGNGVVYLGALDDRFDWVIVKVLAEAFPHERFTLAGPLARPRTDMPSNVRLIGGVAYSEAPQLLVEHAVGVLPLSDHPGNAGRSPMKYYEYLASGLPVLARSSEAMVSRGTPNVWLYESPAAAVDLLKSALSADTQTREAGVDAARFYSWRDRATRLVDFASNLSPRSDRA